MLSVFDATLKALYGVRDYVSNFGGESLVVRDKDSRSHIKDKLYRSIKTVSSHHQASIYIDWTNMIYSDLQWFINFHGNSNWSHEIKGSMAQSVIQVFHDTDSSNSICYLWQLLKSLFYPQAEGPLALEYNKAKNTTEKRSCDYEILNLQRDGWMQVVFLSIPAGFRCVWLSVHL